MKRKLNMAWTDERVELLKEMWNKGASASQIAGKLGHVTRNAVIGKVHRLGLSARATTSRTIQRRRPKAANPNKLKAKSVFNPSNPLPVRALFPVEEVPPVIYEELVIPLSERKTIQTLSEENCRWPIGDPSVEDFHFCGKTKVKGLPYCEFHSRRALQPSKPEKKSLENSLPKELLSSS